MAEIDADTRNAWQFQRRGQNFPTPPERPGYRRSWVAAHNISKRRAEGYGFVYTTEPWAPSLDDPYCKTIRRVNSWKLQEHPGHAEPVQVAICDALMEISEARWQANQAEVTIKTDERDPTHAIVLHGDIRPDLMALPIFRGENVARQGWNFERKGFGLRIFRIRKGRVFDLEIGVWPFRVRWETANSILRKMRAGDAQLLAAANLQERV